jgi:hypothetical protein
MVRLNMDFIGPIGDDQGYILVIIDCFSRWIELYACDNATAQEAARCLLEHFGRYGAPAQILSDNGSHFVNETIKEFLTHVGTEHRLTVAYSKEENAIVERSNKEVNRHVRNLVFDRKIQSRWRQNLPFAMRIINAHPNQLTKVAPVHMLFGKALDLDRGIFNEMPSHLSEPTQPMSQHMSRMLKDQSVMIGIHQAKLKARDDSHLSPQSEDFTTFPDGQYVLLDPVGSPKNRLHARKLGPYLVLSHTDNTYTLQNLVTKREVRVNIHRMHPFYYDATRTDPQEVAAHDEEEFFVEAILSHKGDFHKKRELQFEVRWLGYTSDYDSWEPWKSLMHVDKLHEYLRSIGQEKHIPK